MDASSPESKASPWVTRALIASAVLLLMLNAFLSFLSTARETADDTGALEYWSYQFAGFLGAASVTALIVGAVIGVARLAGRAKTLASKAKLAFWTLVVLLVLNSSILTRNARSPGTTMSRTDVTGAEREGLRVTADSVTHALFGFTLPIAGANLTRSPDLERQMMASAGAHRDIVAWAFRDTVRRGVLIIQVTKLTQVNESRFRAFVTGMRNAWAKSTPVDSTLAWRDSVGEFGLHVVRPTGLHIVMRCLGRTGRLAVVCVETMAAEPSTLHASLVGLEFTRSSGRSGATGSQ